MIAVFGLFFMLAQGIAIFGTAWLLAELTGKAGPLAKLLWMGLSYLGWVAFTFLLFGLMGADIYLLPAAGAASAILPSALFGGMWLVLPYLKRPSNG